FSKCAAVTRIGIILPARCRLPSRHGDAAEMRRPRKIAIMNERPSECRGGTMSRRMTIVAGAMLLLAPGGAEAAKVELTFGGIEIAPGQPIGNTDRIPQDYGDLPGLLDVRYGAVQELGSAVRRVDDALHYWENRYSDLQGVVYCCGLGLTGAAEI